MTEQPSVEVLVATVKAGIAPHPDEPTDVWVTLERDALAALDSLTSRLERAERERDDARDLARTGRESIAMLGLRERDYAEAEARAQKAEAVVEAARPFAVYGHKERQAAILLAALTAYDEPPTGEGGVT